jgi:hypothetical protein
LLQHQLLQLPLQLLLQLPAGRPPLLHHLQLPLQPQPQLLLRRCLLQLRLLQGLLLLRVGCAALLPAAAAWAARCLGSPPSR